MAHFLYADSLRQILVYLILVDMWGSLLLCNHPCLFIQVYRITLYLTLIFFPDDFYAMAQIVINFVHIDDSLREVRIWVDNDTRFLIIGNDIIINRGVRAVRDEGVCVIIENAFLDLDLTSTGNQNSQIILLEGAVNDLGTIIFSTGQ